MSNIALPFRIADYIAEYEEKNEAIEAVITQAEEALNGVTYACTVRGTFVDTVVHPRPYFSAADMRKKLLKSAWKSIYDKMDLKTIASAKDRANFERALQAPVPFTIDNIRATFGDYAIRPRYHILKGLAEQFASLDPAYRSHSNVRIGVKGLPKRIILTSFGEYGYGYGYDKIRDVLNALAAYQGRPLLDHTDLSSMKDDFHRTGQCDLRVSRVVKDGNSDKLFPPRGVLIKRFGNGNGHVFFDDLTLIDINKALAEFYGEILPDMDTDSDVAKRATTAVSKDLAYYPTPPSVVDHLLEAAGVYEIEQYSRREPLRILEPSCGCGRILDGIKSRGHRGIGYEVHSGRAAEARLKGHSVVTGNFLEVPPSPEFDVVLMNPPFAGQHYKKHISHALRFLKPGGRLVTVLPATAWYDDDQKLGLWTDLPVASFADSGTNVPTGYLVVKPQSTARVA